MKCPLSYYHKVGAQGEVLQAVGDCLKEECAWWQGDDEVCWFVQIGIALSSIAGDLIWRR